MMCAIARRNRRAARQTSALGWFVAALHIGLCCVASASAFASPADEGQKPSAPSARTQAPLQVAEAESAKKGGDAKHAKAKDADTEAMPVPSAAPQLEPADQYCSNVQNAAVAAQAAQQKKSLAQAQQEIDKRIKLLSERTDDFQKWLKKREDFLKLASDSLMRIYSSMKPEAASAQLLAMNELVAAAIVFKLPAKSASAILAEMDANRAARLSAVIASAGEVGERKPAQEGAKP